MRKVVVPVAGLILSALSLPGFFSFLSAAPAPVPAEIGAPMLGALAWRNIGPFRAGRVSAVAGAVGQPGVFYIGLPFGGVWKTTSAGTTWFPVFDGVKEIASIGSLAVAPSNPEIVYAGTGDSYRPTFRGNGVYKTIDAGRTWQHLSLGDTKVPEILVDPRDPNIVIVAALGNVGTKAGTRGVFRSADGGGTWQRTLAVDDETGVQDIASAPDHPNVIVAMTARSYTPAAGGAPATSTAAPALFKSTDEGLTWTELTNTGLPASGGGGGGGGGRLRRLAVAANTGAQRMFMAGTGRIYRSDDGGAAWHPVAAGDSRVGSERVYVDSQNPDIVYDMHTSMYRSTDGGATFTSFKGAPGGDDPHVLWIDPTDARRMLLAGDQGATVSVDHGDTWTSWYNQSTAQLYHIAVDRSSPYWVYGQQQDSGAVAVRSRGDLGAITPMDWYPTPGWEAGWIIADPMNPKILYGAGPDSRSQLVKITLSSGQWIHVGPNLDAREHLGSPGPMAWSTFDPHELLVGYTRLMSTVDGGRQWKAIGPDWGSSISALSMSNLSTGLIWAGLSNGAIKVTKDHGATWTDAPIPNLPPQSTVVSIDASHQNAAVAFAAITAADNLPHLFRTRDSGKTWTAIVAGLPGDQVSGSVTNVIRADTRRAGLVFTGTESSVYVSWTDGDAWQPLTLNLPTTAVRDIAIHENDLVIGTFGRGIWILDDYSSLRQMTPAVASEPVHLFRPGAAIRVRRSFNGDTPFPPEIPHAENPPLGVVIDYALARTPSAPVTIEVLDTAGRVVRHFSSAPPAPLAPEPRDVPDAWLAAPKPLPIATGLNRVIWDMRYDDPPQTGEHITIRAVPGETPIHYEGPLALPGVYTIRLTVDGQRVIQTVRVRNDPRSTATIVELRAQHTLQMQIYNGAKTAAEDNRVMTALRGAVAAIGRGPNPQPVADAIAAFSGAIGGGGGGRGRRGGGPGGPGGAGGGAAAPSFDAVNAEMNHLLEELDSADMAPTPAMTNAYLGACGNLRGAVTAWRRILLTNLPALNAALTASHLPPVAAPAPPAMPVCAAASPGAPRVPAP